MSLEKPIRLRRRSRSAGAMTALVVLWTILTLPAGGRAGFPQDKGLQHQVGVSFKLIHVYVTARSGEPMGDLTAEDFEVFDNGKIQKVSHFEKHFQESGQDPVDRIDILPTNRKFFLVFDFAFMDQRGIVKAKDAALKFLETEMRSTDEIGLISYSTGRGLVLHEYLTHDHERIRRIVEGFGLKHYAGRAERLTSFVYAADLEDMEQDIPVSGSSGDAPQFFDTQFYENQARLQTGQSLIDGRQTGYVNNARAFITSLRHMARVFRLIPGFKNVILFSGGIQSRLIFGKRGGATVGDWTTPEQLQAQLSAYDAAQADRGLQSDFTDMLKDFAASNAPVFAVDASRAIRDSDITSREGFDPTTRELDGADSLKQFASATGGKFYGNTVENVRIASDIQKVTGAYYVLGYAIDEKWDGKFHKIKVRVKRKGLNVTAQGGYYGSKPFKEYTPFEKLIHVVDLALSDIPQVQTPLGIPVGGMPVMVKGWPQLLVFGRAGLAVHQDILGKNTEAYLLLFNENGDFSHIERFKLAVPETGKEILIPSFLTRVKPGACTCRLVIRNMDTGRGARGAVPMIIPAAVVSGPAMDPPLLLLEAWNSMDLADSPGESPSDLYGYDPNGYTPLLGDIPEGVRTLHAALRLTGFTGASDMDISVSRGEPSASAWTELPVTILKKDRDKYGMTFLIAIELNGTDPGRYRLEFKAGEKESGAAVAASVSIDIAGK